MELARNEWNATKPVNWGQITFENLKKREGKLGQSADEPPRKAVADALLANPTITGPLDGGAVLTELSENDQCDFFSKYPKCQTLWLRNWSILSLKVLRSMSFVFAEQLLEIDFSSSCVNESHLEVLLVRATSLHILKLNNCPRLDTMSMNVVTKLTSSTLRELYVNACPLFTTEPILCIGGCSGFRSSGLGKLQCLDLGDCPAVDAGVASLAKGCRKLLYLNLLNCVEISDLSVTPVAKACKRLQLINLSGCVKITTKAVMAIGNNLSQLISLNLSRCLLVTDKGIKALASGCPDLQAVNLAGLVKVTETALFHLADKCKGLLMLNVTGCERVTINGIEALVRGLPFVEKGISFMGFKPADQHVERKLMGHLAMLQQSAYLEKRDKQVARARQEEQNAAERDAHFNSNAGTIQNYMYRYKLRMHFYRLWRKRVARQSACTVQRIFRGHKGRARADAIRAQIILFLSLSPYALKLQRHTRGYLCRIHNTHVCKAVRLMYLMRIQEAETAIAVRFQSHGRRYLANLRVKAVKELRVRRLLNMNHAILLMQMMVRRCLARLHLYKRRRDKRNMDQARHNASIKIKVFCVEGMRRYKGRLSGDELKRFFRVKWAATVVLQRSYRGFKTRENVRKLRIQMATQYYAASQIQRVFRGSRILQWKDMRLNVIASYVLDRHYIERGVSIVAARARYKQYVSENQCDSASDEEDDLEEEVLWTKLYDAKRKRNYWQNFATTEVTFDEPQDTLAHEKAMVGRRIRVFWVVQSAWYEGAVTRYHRRKRRHRVEYDDGDHEWINLTKESDRVQVQMDDGGWAMYLMFQSEAQQTEWKKIDDKRDREGYKEQAFRDALQWKMFIDDHTQHIMFLSQVTGEVRAGTPNANEWAVQDDGFGFPCFYNTLHETTVFEDPRFIYDVDEDLAAQRKYVLQEMRYAMYFCQDYWERYNQALALNDKKQIYLCIMTVRNSPKPTHLDSFIIRARGLYKVVSVVDRPMDQVVLEELEYASWLAERMGEIRDKSEELLLARRDAKLTIVDKLTEKSGQQAFCRYCKRETQRHLEYCPTCGKPQIFMK